MADVMEYKCPSCGGAIQFDSSSQQMTCPYCDSSFTMEEMKAYDEILNKQGEEKLEWRPLESEEWSDEEKGNFVTYSCNSCGGEIVGDQNTAATKCPFCDSPVVMTNQFSGMLKPNFIIPFKLDKNAAKEALKNHTKGKILLPKSFKTDNRIEEVLGMYVPFWLFDCDTDSDITYKATTVQTWSDSDYNYTKTDYYSLYREGEVGFQRVPVDGSSKMDDDIMESIEPYSYNDLMDFQTAYMAGYVADKYDVDAEASIVRANERIKNSVEELFRGTCVGYTTCIAENTNVRFSEGEIKYALMPIWILNTKYKDKMYTFAMNGQTGKFVGDLPINWTAFFIWLFGLSVGLSLVFYMIAGLF